MQTFFDINSLLLFVVIILIISEDLFWSGDQQWPHLQTENYIKYSLAVKTLLFYNLIAWPVYFILVFW